MGAQGAHQPFSVISGPGREGDSKPPDPQRPFSPYNAHRPFSPQIYNAQRPFSPQVFDVPLHQPLGPPAAALQFALPSTPENTETYARDSAPIDHFPIQVSDHFPMMEPASPRDEPQWVGEGAVATEGRAAEKVKLIGLTPNSQVDPAV
jgi:hypothetical protein